MDSGGKKYVLIGDSLGCGQGSDKQHGWAYYFAQQVGFDNCVISVHAHYGFTRVEEESKSSFPNGFLELLNVAKITNPSEITDVIVLGGLNDCYSGAGTDVLLSAINDFYARAKQLCPNAEVWTGMLGSCSSDYDNSTLRRIREVVLPVMKSSSCRYIHNCEYLCRKYWLYSDTIHLTDVYYQEIGRQIAAEFRNGINVSGNTVYPKFVYDNSIFHAVDNPPIQTNGVMQDGVTTIFHGTKSCCFWPINNSKLHILWKDNAMSIHLGNTDVNTYYSGIGDNIIPVTGFLGYIPEEGEDLTEKFYNFSGALNVNARHVNLDIGAVMGTNTFVYLKGYITRICFMYPTTCVSTLLG